MGVIAREFVFLNPGETLNPDYYWIDAEVVIDGERECTPAQAKYYYDDLTHRFCNYKEFMEAYNGLRDEVNSPVTPETPQ